MATITNLGQDKSYNMDKVVYFAGHHQHYIIMQPNLILKGSYVEPLYLPLIKVKINNGKEGNERMASIPLNALVDTGANTCFINSLIVQKLKCDLIKENVSVWDTQKGSYADEDVYDVFFNVLDLSNQPFRASFTTLKNVNPEYDLVLGTRFLDHFKFTLNGKLQTFELEYLTRL